MSQHFTERDKFLMNEFVKTLPTVAARLNVNVIAVVAITSECAAAVITCPGFDHEAIQKMLDDITEFRKSGGEHEIREYTLQNFKPGSK